MFRLATISTPFARIATCPKVARAPSQPRIAPTFFAGPVRRWQSTSSEEKPGKFKVGANSEWFVEEDGAHTATSFHGISKSPLPKDVTEKLMQKINSDDVEIRPDGIIYLPEIKYRRILNAAIGPGGWALLPRPNTIVCRNGSYSREFALFCYGNFISQSRGEASYYDKEEPNFGQLDEAAKSNALMRCCKDLGVSSELWDPKFIGPWREQFATEVWVENVSNGVKKKLWRKKDAKSFGYPYREITAPQGGFQASASSSSSSAAGSFRPIPPLGAAPAAKPAAAAAAGGGAEDADFDINAPVPPGLKKMEGKKWSEVIATKEGRDYLNWVVQNSKSPKTQREAKRALDYAIAVDFDKSS